MVAKVNSGKNILGLLNYNENKVKEGVATCIGENMFGCNVDRLSFYDKLNTFRSLTTRNLRAHTNAVHISLNFGPSEKLNNDILNAIANQYMDKIGFGNQPFLVYQHFDAAHPHIHIVTTNIQVDGKRISLHDIGKNQSEKARKEIERDFGLVKAKGRKQAEPEIVERGDAKRAVYGKSETKRSISNVVRYVVRDYKYTSVPELNAVLQQFNVRADINTHIKKEKGKEDVLTQGLTYHITNEHGKAIGVGVKASLIYDKPTLKNLGKNFQLNDRLRKKHKERLVRCIESTFGNSQVISKAKFTQGLLKEGVTVVFRQNDEGRIYGLTFVDNKTKVVFNGSDLGKQYGAKAITERLTGLSKPDSTPVKPVFTNAPDEKVETKDSSFGEVLSDLTAAKQFDFSSPDSAMKRKKRKKKRGRSI